MPVGCHEDLGRTTVISLIYVVLPRGGTKTFLFRFGFGFSFQEKTETETMANQNDMIMFRLCFGQVSLACTKFLVWFGFSFGFTSKTETYW